MATYTDYFSLTKPDLADNADIAVLNQNTTKIDLIMHQNRQMSADAYDTTETYDEGDIVIYENVLYKCKADNVSGNWDSTKWEVTTLAKEIANGGGGGGDASKTELTQAQYDALVQAGTVDPDMMYFITDGQGSGGGGGSAYSETNLYTASSTSFTDISVTWNWVDYDAYLFFCNDVNSQTGNPWFITKGIITSIIGSQTTLTFYPYSSASVHYYVTANQLTASSQTQGFYIRQIVGLKFGGGSSEVNYSTTEHKVGTWIDGRDIYEKTYSITPSSLPVDWTALETIGIDTLISYETQYVISNGQVSGCDGEVRIAYNPPNEGGKLCYYFTNSSIVSFIATVRYTKLSS